MPKQNSLLRIGIMLLFSTYSLYATWYDNRYINFFDRQTTWLYDESSLFGIECFVAQGREAWGTDGIVGIPEIHGFLDLKILADGFVEAGRPNPIPTPWQGASIPFVTRGQLHAEGIEFLWHQCITDLWSFGASWLFMNVNSCQTFNLNTVFNDPTRPHTNLLLGPGDQMLLDEIRRMMFLDIGLHENFSHQIGFGDMNFYIQLGKRWEYELKCRSVKAGMRFGVLAPTGLKQELDAPASIPFGGNGHWGLYFSAHGMLEIKEDLKIGVLLDITKRFSKVMNHRVPVAGEPDIFGVLIAPINVNPGPNVAFSAYITMQNVRDGLALGLMYTLVKHQQDRWHDVREDRTIPIKLEQVVKLSEWGISYFTLSAAYDFGKMKVKRSFEPIVSVRWDAPYELFVTEQAVKTHKLSLSIDFVF